MQIPQITFTRFLACFAILVLHFGYFTWPMSVNPLASFRDDLINAMSYFFLLSGFILVVSDAKKDTLPPKINTFKFWKRRAARILPLYYLSILLFFLINFSYRTDLHIIWQLQPYAYTLLLLQSWKYTLAMDVNFPAWSLSVEAFFYFIYPFIYLFLRKMKSSLLISFALLFWMLNCAMFVYLKDLMVHEHFLHYFPLLHLATFVLGISAGLLFVRHYVWLKEDGRKYIKGYTLLIGLFLLYTGYNNWTFHAFQHNGLLAPFFVLLIYSISLSKGKIGKVLGLKPFVFLGNISFAMYILQLPIYQLCSQHIPFLKTLDKSVLFWPYLITLIVFSSFIHKVFEQPIRRMITR
jgi:peptidoglycan/LPS O-acetylase OafA/YrhL